MCCSKDDAGISGSPIISASSLLARSLRHRNPTFRLFLAHQYFPSICLYSPLLLPWFSAFLFFFSPGAFFCDGRERWPASTQLSWRRLLCKNYSNVKMENLKYCVCQDGRGFVTVGNICIIFFARNIFCCWILSFDVFFLWVCMFTEFFLLLKLCLIVALKARSVISTFNLLPAHCLTSGTLPLHRASASTNTLHITWIRLHELHD